MHRRFAKLSILVVVAALGVLLASLASSAQAIDPYTGTTITPYTAPTIAPYTAPTIKRIKSRRPIRRFLRHGVVRPVSCGGPCTILQRIWLAQINWNIISAYSASSHRVVVGRSSSSLGAAGDAKVLTKLRRHAKKVLRKARHSFRVTLVTTVHDEQGAHTSKQKLKIVR